jgi:hypothetical protein
MRVHIISADGIQQTYEAVDLQREVGEGRVSLSCLAQIEGAARWRPLKDIPDVLNMIAPQLPPAEVSKAGSKKGQLPLPERRPWLWAILSLLLCFSVLLVLVVNFKNNQGDGGWMVQSVPQKSVPDEKAQDQIYRAQESSVVAWNAKFESAGEKAGEETGKAFKQNNETPMLGLMENCAKGSALHYGLALSNEQVGTVSLLTTWYHMGGEDKYIQSFKKGFQKGYQEKTPAENGAWPWPR